MGSSRTARVPGLIAVAAVAAMLLGASQASAATISWSSDVNPYSGRVNFNAAPGESNDLTITASQGPSGSPQVVTVVDQGATLQSGVTTPPPPGSCDAGTGCNVPCRIESPHKVTCAIADGFSDAPRPLNPLEQPSHSFGRVFVALGDGNDEVTVPAQTVSFLAKISESDGNNRMRLTHTAAGVDSNGGDTIAFGPGSSGTVNIWGAGTTVYAVDGGAEYIYCSYAGLQPKLRLDVFDSTNGQCGTDVLPPQTP